MDPTTDFLIQLTVPVMSSILWIGFKSKREKKEIERNQTKSSKSLLVGPTIFWPLLHQWSSLLQFIGFTDM